MPVRGRGASSSSLIRRRRLERVINTESSSSSSSISSVAVARTVLRQTLDHKADAAYASEACRMLLLMLGIAEREAGRIATAPLPVAG